MPALCLKLIRGHHVGTRAGELDEFGHALAPIEISEGCHHGFPLGLRPGEAYGIRQLVFWNINRCFHEAIIVLSGFLAKKLPDGSLTKAALVEEVAHATDLTKKRADVIVDTLFRSIAEARRRGRRRDRKMVHKRNYGS